MIEEKIDNIVIPSLTKSNITCSNIDGSMKVKFTKIVVKIDYKKTREDAILPTQGSAEAAGYDLYVPEYSDDIEIPAHSTKIIDIGLSIAIPEYYFGAIFARSGLATKQGLRPANCVGVIDSDYRGSICVALHNDTDIDKVIKGGERIAQLVLLPCVEIQFDKKDFLENTERNDNSFGSTGK